MTQNLELIKKMGGVTVLLISSLGIANSALALNPTIGNLSNPNDAFESNGGQSFINDPINGTGSLISLDSWIFTFSEATSATNALGATLNIYLGTGNGGTLVGSSSVTVPTTYVTENAVQWTFANLQITDNLVYTASISNFLSYEISFANPYADGTATIGTNTYQTVNGVDADFVFQGNFSSLTPVPFEFSPALGLVGLGALWAGKKFLLKK